MIPWIIGFAFVVLVVAALTYPGEWSHLSPAASRWLYDRSAGNYQRKWSSGCYAAGSHSEKIARHVATGISASGVKHVLDLGCGTGRGVRLLEAALSIDTRFTLIDFSPGMLRQLRQWLAARGAALSGRTAVIECELGAWAEGAATEQYGAVLLLEVGEFLPQFAAVMRRIGVVTAPGGALVMTRPAGLWSRFFPLRGQSRAALTQLLSAAGFERPEFVRWRSRYELVFSRKAPA